MQLQDVEAILGVFSYQSESVVRSAFTTGEIYYKRDENGNFEPPVGLDPVLKTLPVQNARLSTYTLDNNGFTLVNHSYDHIDYLSEDEIVNIYYAECARLVKEVTGARKVAVFDRIVRSGKVAALRQR